MVTLRFQTEVCPTVFGLSQHSLPRQIAFTNTYYGGDSPHTHRVLYVNGESSSKHHVNHRDQEIIGLMLITGGIDPWKELSVIQDCGEGDEDQVVFIEDTAHCADMMSNRPTDRSSLKTARAVPFICCHYNIIIIQIKHIDSYGVRLMINLFNLLYLICGNL